MRLRHLIIAGRLIVLVIVGAVAWYLISPLFMNTTVDESSPFEVPSQKALAQMSATEVQEIEAEFLAAIPGEQAMGKSAGR